MKIFHASILAAVALIAGAVGGSWIEHHRVTAKYRFLALDFQLAEVSQAFEDVQKLRQGDTNAVIYRLERELDTGVVYLSQVEKPQTKDSPSDYGGMWPAIKAYRAKFPCHSTSTNWDDKVTAAMAKIPNPTPY
jgi:hypothetical protein